MTPRRLTLLLPLLAGAVAPLTAQTEFAIGGAIGTTGPAVSVSARGARLGVRLGTSFASWSYRQKLKGTSFTADLKFKARQALVDFFPSGGSFHLTGGVMGPPVGVHGLGHPSLIYQTIVINGTAYPASQVGDLVLDLTWSSMSPYVGLGWSGGLGGQRMKITADIGAVISGSPDVALSASKAAQDSQLAADVAAQRIKIQDALDTYAKIYPVLALGVKIRL